MVLRGLDGKNRLIRMSLWAIFCGTDSLSLTHLALMREERVSRVDIILNWKTYAIQKSGIVRSGISSERIYSISCFAWSNICNSGKLRKFLDCASEVCS